MSKNTPPASFTDVKSTAMHTLPIEKKGRLVGTAVVAGGKNMERVSAVIGYVPGGEGVEAGTRTAVVAPVVTVGNMTNFDMEGAHQVLIEHAKRAAAAKAQAATNATDGLSGVLPAKGVKISDRITVAEVNSTDGTPDKAPAKTPVNVTGRIGTIFPT